MDSRLVACVSLEASVSRFEDLHLAIGKISRVYSSLRSKFCLRRVRRAVAAISEKMKYSHDRTCHLLRAIDDYCLVQESSKLRSIYLEIDSVASHISKLSEDIDAIEKLLDGRGDKEDSAYVGYVVSLLRTKIDDVYGDLCSVKSSVADHLSDNTLEEEDVTSEAATASTARPVGASDVTMSSVPGSPQGSDEE
ncbi:hypothetical protein [Eastern grey kangaroopox virus]|uniref:Uncharacterized protein n=1 Tax=Eastern grey kangaroopox virus TaxID=2042482 RepID=A0A2C9DSX3_9POXV|nr:hypothetical protein KM541_gp010 [Eastern grey kangaroopox virus]ATI21106.1 hypothetical protein [Eastern grey kangaroopox virus]ATX75011.1 hypothetical protein EKPV-NSW-ORF018 [Eastern grey kangaroopox virus]